MYHLCRMKKKKQQFQQYVCFIHHMSFANGTVYNFNGKTNQINKASVNFSSYSQHDHEAPSVSDILGYYKSMLHPFTLAITWSWFFDILSYIHQKKNNTQSCLEIEATAIFTAELQQANHHSKIKKINLNRSCLTFVEPSCYILLL